MFTQESLKRIRLMVKVFTNIRMDQSMMGIGKMMLKTDSERKSGMMVHILKDTLRMDKNMVKEHINGEITHIIVVNGWTM
jgi:hypothetical protein